MCMLYIYSTPLHIHDNLYTYAEHNELEMEMRYVENYFSVDPLDALACSGSSLTLKPSSMGFSVVKLILPYQENAAVESVCATVWNANRLELQMFQKDPQGNKKSTMLVSRNVSSAST